MPLVCLCWIEIGEKARLIGNNNGTKNFLGVTAYSKIE